MEHKDELQSLLLRLSVLENRLQTSTTTAENLKDTVVELEKIVRELDKTLSVQSEKQTNLLFRFDVIGSEVEKINEALEKLETADKHIHAQRNSWMEKIIMAIIGALITYFFNVLR